MALYERLVGFPEPGVNRISAHMFQAVMGEFARGRLTGAQAQSIINTTSGEALDPAGVTEAQALLATITGSASAKLARVKEIDDVLLLADVRAPGYSTAAEIRTRLTS